MDKFKDNILNKIQAGEIKKTSKWYFLTKNYFFWGFFTLSIILGSIAFSSCLIQLFHEAGPWHKLSWEQNNISYFFRSLPYLWIVFIIIFIYLADLNYRHTDNGFKYKNYLIVSSSILISLIFGIILFYTGAGNRIENRIKRHIPIYEEYRMERKKEMIKILEKKGINTEEFFQNRQIKHKNIHLNNLKDNM